MPVEVQRWSASGLMARIAIVALTGVAVATSSLHHVFARPNFSDPVTEADFFAVYAYSAAWLLTAASLLILREAARPAPELSRSVLVVAAVCAMTGIANGIEDGLGFKSFGLPYVIGSLGGLIGMPVIAAMFWTSPARNLAFVPAIGGIAMITVTIGGGVLGIPAWLGFAAILIRERGKADGESSAT